MLNSFQLAGNEQPPLSAAGEFFPSLTSQQQSDESSSDGMAILAQQQWRGRRPTAGGRYTRVGSGKQEESKSAARETRRRSSNKTLRLPSNGTLTGPNFEDPNDLMMAFLSYVANGGGGAGGGGRSSGGAGGGGRSSGGRLKRTKSPIKRAASCRPPSERSPRRKSVYSMTGGGSRSRNVERSRTRGGGKRKSEQGTDFGRFPEVVNNQPENENDNNLLPLESQRQTSQIFVESHPPTTGLMADADNRPFSGSRNLSQPSARALTSAVSLFPDLSSRATSADRDFLRDRRVSNLRSSTPPSLTMVVQEEQTNNNLATQKQHGMRSRFLRVVDNLTNHKTTCFCFMSPPFVEPADFINLNPPPIDDRPTETPTPTPAVAKNQESPLSHLLTLAAPQQRFAAEVRAAEKAANIIVEKALIARQKLMQEARNIAERKGLRWQRLADQKFEFLLKSTEIESGALGEISDNDESDSQQLIIDPKRAEAAKESIMASVLVPQLSMTARETLLLRSRVAPH